MSIKEQIESGLRGECSVSNLLIHRYAKQQNADAKNILNKFEESAKTGKHRVVYIGRPADWTFVPAHF